MDYEKHIQYLKKTYSETSIGKGEKLSSATVRRINKTYDKNQQKRRVDAILNNVKNKDSIKKEVHDITDSVQLKRLCYNCKEEQIIAVIILYVQKTRNKDYRVERASLWKEYDLTWSIYGLILGRLLEWTRKQKNIKPKCKVDDGIFIR